MTTQRSVLRRDGAIDRIAIRQDVNYLQSFLKDAGFLPSTAVVDGWFDIPTESAVRVFQLANNLANNGIVDSKTWTVLESYRHLFLRDDSGVASQAKDTVSPSHSQAASSPSVVAEPPDLLKPASLNKTTKETYSKSLLRRGAGIAEHYLCERVKYLQSLLQRGLFLPEDAEIDGKFGRQTENAVKFFQVRQKLIADGVVGQSTWCTLEAFIASLDNKTLQASPEETKTTPIAIPDHPHIRSYPILRKGDGISAVHLRSDIKLLQHLLQKVGILGADSPIDGLFGSITEQALRSFQASRNLKVDGEAGNQTWSCLLDQWVSVHFPCRPLLDYGDRLIDALPDSCLQPYAQRAVPLILQECQRAGVLALSQVAYIMATALHESRFGQEMLPPASGFRDEGREDLGNLQPGDGSRYRGRGFVPIRGRLNYTRWGDRLGYDLVSQPELAEEQDIAAKIIVLGMRDGSFTGHKLDDYLSSEGEAHLQAERQDFRFARHIIRNLDNADLIAEYAENFLRAMR